jgi:DNA polymerase elongation subunit (family B)
MYSPIQPLDGEVFDIETRGAQGLAQTLGIQEKILRVDEMEDVEDMLEFAFQEEIALGNAKKYESVKKVITEKLDKIVSKAAVKLYGAEIYAIAYAGLAGGKVKAMAVTDEVDEAKLIRTFLEALDQGGPHCMVGFNIRGFDLPILRARCAFHQIHWPAWLPRTVREDRYDTNVVFDIMDVLDEGPLDTWLRVFGLPPKTASGAKVAEMSPREVAQYCADDVERERLLARRVMRNTKHVDLVGDDE